MREILLIHHRLPYPLNNGMDKLRYNLLVTLSKQYRVSLAAPVDEHTKPEWIEIIRSIVFELVTVSVLTNEVRIKKSRWLYFLRLIRMIIFRIPNYSSENYYEEFKDHLVTLIRKKQFYFIQILSDFSADYLPYLPKDIFKITGPMDDIIELSWQNMFYARRKIKKLGLWFEYRATKRHFSIICKQSNLVLFHSNQDLSRVKRVLGFDFNANVLPVATERVDKADVPIMEIEYNSIVFVGGFGSFFNYDAAMHLVNDILPIIRKKIPEVKLYLVGNHPPASLIELAAHKNILVTGEVTDVSPFIKKAAVYVSSVRIGTGIKTKVIEALSMSKAMVVSSASLHGLWEIDDSIYICDDNNDFAECVISLLQNPDLRKIHEIKSGALYNKAYAISKAEMLTLGCYNKYNIQV